MANIGLKVRDENEQQVVDIMTKCHDWLANELDIKSNMAFGRTCHWGKDAFHAGLWSFDTEQSVLNFRNLYGANMYQMLKIVAHEARHAVQGATGMIDWTKDRDVKSLHNGRWESGTWNGEYWSGAYRDAPWEVDARAHEEVYAQMVIDAGIITQEELSIKLAGRDGDSDHMIVRLDTETLQEIEQEHGKVSLWKAAVQTKEEDDANTELFRNIVSKSYTFNQKSNMWFNNPDCDLSYKEAKKVWEDAKKETKLKYQKDAIAFLTVEETAKLKKAKASKNDMFWAAQKNMVVYKTRPATEDDLVY
jgi:hypothetical protein